MYTKIVNVIQDEETGHSTVTMVEVDEDDTVDNLVTISDLQSGMHKCWLFYIQLIYTVLLLHFLHLKTCCLSTTCVSRHMPITSQVKVVLVAADILTVDGQGPLVFNYYLFECRFNAVEHVPVPIVQYMYVCGVQ